MATSYNSQQPVTDFGLPFASLKYDTTLAANTEQTLTIPARYQKYKAVFSYASGADVWVANNATATVAGAAFAATDSELNPQCREVKAGDVLHFISIDTSSEIGVALFTVDSIS